MSESQKFLSRNRAPRVQIEYDVELYGAEKKVQLPFVMGVMSDLSGTAPRPDVADSAFLEIDADNFDDRMRGVAPRVQFKVPNTLTGEGSLAVDLSFEKMSDFAPAAIAAKVDALRPLLEARTQLSNLMAYMDGKSGAEALIEKILADPSLLEALAGAAKPEADASGVLSDLASKAPVDPEPGFSEADRTLGALAATELPDEPEVSAVEEVLSNLAVPERDEEDASDEDALASLRMVEVQEEPAEDDTDAVLSGLATIPAPEDASEKRASDVLSEMPGATEEVRDEGADDILAAIDRSAGNVEAGPSLDDVLSSIEVTEAAPEADSRDDVLASLPSAPNEESEAGDIVGDVLKGIGVTSEVSEDEGNRLDEILAGIEAVSDDEPTAPTADDVLSSIEVTEAALEVETHDDVLASLPSAPEEKPKAGDTVADVLEGVAESDEADVDAAAELDDILAGFESAPDEDTTGPTADDVLSGIEAVESSSETDTREDVLASLQTTADEGLEAGDTAHEALKALALAGEATEDAETDLDDILAAIETVSDGEPIEVSDDIDSLLTDLGQGSGAPEARSEETVDRAEGDAGEVEDLDALLAAFDDHAEGGEEVGAADEPITEREDELDGLLTGMAEEVPEEESAQQTPSLPEPGADLDDLLAGMGDFAEEDDKPEPVEEPAPELEDALNAHLSGIGNTGGAEEETAAGPAPPVDDLDALLAGIADEPVGAAETSANEEPEGDLDALLAGIGETAGDTAGAVAAEDTQGDVPEDDLDALLSGLDEEIVAGDDPAALTEPVGEMDDDLDALLAGMEETAGDTAEAVAAKDTQGDVLEDDLDALLSGLDEETAAGEDPAASTEPVGEMDDDLDALLADVGGEGSDAAISDAASGRAEEGFGVLAAPRPSPETLNRKKFRIAFFGDFSGRSARGVIETGAALAGRRAIALDVDEIEAVIEGFATELVLPLSADGTGVVVPLREMDDLHPDELYENVEIFEALSGLRQQLKTGSMAAKATERLHEWSRQYATPVAVPQRSSATSVPADRRLSDFQALIGDTRATLTRTTPTEELIARIVGPHVVKAPDEGVGAMLAAVDSALESAMRLILHHPDFQAVEAQWRSLDLLARRIETDEKLEIVLFDVSAEELAIDLAAVDDLANSGLFGLLNAALDPETGDGGFSALFGLYGFEETPPHADLLGRIAQVAAFADAPFFGAMSPAFLDTPEEERHPLVAKAWDRLRVLPEAAYVGLASPRFLLRLPYGARSEPISVFPFEEFSIQKGLSGMLWANPVVLVAILLAAAWKKDGKAMSLGGVMTMGDMPFHYVIDRYGDQVALPCTERNMTQDAAQKTLGRGYMPVVSPKGRNEVRLASFRSLAGTEIAGPWSGDAPRPARDGGGDGVLTIEMDLPVNPPAEADDLDASLDELLAGFADEAAPAKDAGTEEMDPELAALLEGL